MMSGVATVAQGDQVAWLVESPCSSRDQVMDVCFAPGARLPASPAGVAISSENNRSDLTPAVDLFLARCLKNCLRQVRCQGRQRGAVAWLAAAPCCFEIRAQYFLENVGRFPKPI